MNKKLDLLVLVGITAMSAGASLYYSLSFLPSTVLFFGLPFIYLIVRKRKQIGKILFASIAFTGLYGTSISLILTLNKAWYIPETLIPGRYLGVMPYDEIVYGILFGAFVIAFYEHFFDASVGRRWPRKRIATFILLGMLLLAIVSFIVVVSPTSLLMPYAYASICISALIPWCLALCIRPKLIRTTALVSVFFAFVLLVQELTALYMGHWYFFGEYFGLVSIGSLTFPLEELVFWIIFSGTAIAAYYELIFDNQRN